MAKRTDIKTILIIGSGPIVIGQACEFDYSGTQACKALKEEGYKVVLVNSNPATIMTDTSVADNGFPAEHGSAGVDNDVVADIGMAFYAFYGIAVGIRGEAFRADGDALIEFDSFSYDGSFTNHHACAVVNEEVFTDLCSRVDIDTCRPVSQFGYEAGQNGQLDAIEKVSDPVSRKSFDRGVAKDYFHTAGSSGIAFIGGGDIGHEQTSYFGKGCGKRGGSPFIRGEEIKGLAVSEDLDADA